jgi:hypothetical protein
MTDVLGAAPQTPMTQWNEIRQDTYLPRSEDMPRTKSAATIDSTAVDAATLERQMLADSSINPDYTPEPTPFDEFDAEPSRDERIAALDARDDALAASETVRPSMQCGLISPDVGMRCTHRQDHGGKHTWERSAFDGPLDGLDQAELPGMPEEPVTDWTVPSESAFRGAKLMESAGLAAIGAKLIEDDESLKHLDNIDIRYFWRRRGGTQGGLPRYGRIKKPSAYEALAFGSGVVFLLDLSADHVREAKFTDQQISAQIHEQLCRTSMDPDDHDAYRIDALDFSGSIRTFDKFGAYKPEVREAHAHMALVPVDQEPEADEASDDEGAADE